MYDAEVLSKFPVVQHFPFGSLFSWEHDPDAIVPTATMHTSNQPSRHNAPINLPQSPQASPVETQVPWAMPKPELSSFDGTTQAPWAINPAQSVTSMKPAHKPRPYPVESPSRFDASHSKLRDEGKQLDASIASPSTSTKSRGIE